MDAILNEKLCVDVAGLCEAMSIGKSTAYELINSESFYPAFKLKGKWLVNVDKLKKWLDEQGREGGESE